MKSRVYELVLETPQAPPWFEPVLSDEIKVDVEIRLGEIPSAKDEDSAGAEIQVLSYPGLASVLIESGSSVVVRLEHGVDPHVLDLLLTGPILGVLLHQRGFLVLHASAVQLNGKAVVFTGASALGKSTTAARLYQDGFACVADDVVPLTSKAGGVETVPGYPLHKLWPDAAEALGLDPEALPTIGLQGEKRQFEAPRGFRANPLRVACIYVLSPGIETRIEPLTGHAAFVEILRHSYLARYLDQPGRQARHLTEAEHLLQAVSVRRLTQGPLDELNTLPDLIRQDLEEVRSGLK